MLSVRCGIQRDVASIENPLQQCETVWVMIFRTIDSSVLTLCPCFSQPAHVLNVYVWVWASRHDVFSTFHLSLAVFLFNLKMTVFSGAAGAKYKKNKIK